MSLCLQVEQAAAKWLRSGQNLTQWVTEQGEFVVAENGIRIVFHNGFTLDIPVLTDEGNIVNVEYPAIICSCTELTEPEELHPTGIHVGELGVIAKFPGDNSSAQPDVLAALEDAAKNLYRALYRPDLKWRLSEQIEGFSCTAVSAPRQQTRDRDGRVRVYTMTLTLWVSHADYVDWPKFQPTS